MYGRKFNAPSDFGGHVYIANGEDDRAVKIDHIRPNQGLWEDGTRKITWEVPASWGQYLAYPWHRPSPLRPDFLDSIVHWLLEVIGSFLLGWWVNHVKFHTSTSVVDSFVLGAVYALTFRMAWGWTVDLSLRRHLNWAITLAYGIVGRSSFIGFVLFYGPAQFLGAGLAGLALRFFSATGIPDYATAGATDGMFVFAAIFCTFLITFSVIYNELLEFPSEEEHQNHKRAGTLTAIMILLSVTIFRRYDIYSFGNVVYFAALTGCGWSSACSNLPSTGLLDYGAELGLPLVGAIGGGAVFWIAYKFITLFVSRKEPEGTRNDAEAQIQTLLVQQKMQRTQPMSSNHSLADTKSTLTQRTPLQMRALHGN